MNRKKILGIVILITVVSLAVFNMNIPADKSASNDVSLLNVEALAQQETDPPDCVQIRGFCQTPTYSTDQLGFK